MKTKERRGKVVQFAIYARDPKRLAAFYREVFGWESSPFLASTELGSTEVHVIENLSVKETDLTARIETPPETGPRLSGFECTIAVESVTTVAAAALENGGTILDRMPFVPGVGGRLRVADPEGNVVTAMQFADEGGGTPSE